MLTNLNDPTYAELAALIEPRPSLADVYDSAPVGMVVAAADGGRAPAEIEGRVADEDEDD